MLYLAGSNDLQNFGRKLQAGKIVVLTVKKLLGFFKELIYFS